MQEAARGRSLGGAMTSSARTADTHAGRAAGWLVIGTATLVATDVVGGAVAVLADVNTVGEAWSSKAVLAAPWPMILAQVGLAWGAVRRRDRWAQASAGLLGVACAVSAVSGFFDGQLAREDLPGAVVAGQWVLVTVTAGVGGLAVSRLVELRRPPTGAPRRG